MNRKSMNKSRELATQGLSDLEWLAFQFLAEELDGAARDTFERQLESDVDAQNAVAKMLDLTIQAELAFQRQPFVDVDILANKQFDGVASPRIEHVVAPDRSSSLPNFGQSWLSPISVLAAVAATLLLGIAIWQNLADKSTSNIDNKLALIWAENVIDEAEYTADDAEFDDNDDDDEAEFVYLDADTENWLASAMSYLDEDDLGHLK
jgi:hypothetical protein